MSHKFLSKYFLNFLIMLGASILGDWAVAGYGGGSCGREDLDGVFRSKGTPIIPGLSPLPKEFLADPMDLVSPNGDWMLSAHKTDNNSADLIFFKIPPNQIDLGKLKPHRISFTGELLARTTSPDGSQIFLVTRHPKSSTEFKMEVHTLSTHTANPKPVTIFSGSVKSRDGDFLDTASTKADLFEMGIFASSNDRVGLLLQDSQSMTFKLVLTRGNVSRWESRLVSLGSSDFISSTDGRKLAFRYNPNYIDNDPSVLVLRTATLDNLGAAKTLKLQFGNHFTSTQLQAIREGQILIPNLSNQIIINSTAGILVFDSTTGHLLKNVNVGWNRASHTVVQISNFGAHLMRGIKERDQIEVVDLVQARVIGGMNYSNTALLEPHGAYAISDLGPSEPKIQILDTVNRDLMTFHLEQQIPDYGFVTGIHIAKNGSMAFVGYQTKVFAGKNSERRAFAIRFP